MKVSIVIEYCHKCGWMLRAAYYAQELLTTFAEEIGAVILKPAEKAGSFTISTDSGMLLTFTSGKFPEVKELKQVVRDVVAPGKAVGHSDRKAAAVPMPSDADLT